MSTALIVILVLLVLGGALGSPAGRTYTNWGYGPSISLGTLALIILLIWLFSGRI